VVRHMAAARQGCALVPSGDKKNSGTCDHMRSKPCYPNLKVSSHYHAVTIYNIMSKDYNIDMVQKSVSPVLPKTMKSGKSVDFQYKIQIWGGVKNRAIFWFIARFID
jgi:hypothetical protein